MRNTSQPSRGTAAGPSARVHLALLGGFHLTINGETTKLKNRKAQALLAYLALCPNHRDTRQRLAGLLWSEAGEERARASLRQTLHDLRVLTDACCVNFLDLSNDWIALLRDAIDVDVWQLTGPAPAVIRDDAIAGQSQLHETLMMGFEDIDPSFQTWLGVQRQGLHDRLVRALEVQMTNAGSSAEQRKTSADMLLALDPTHEGACQFLMLQAAERGDVGGALKIYKALWDLLDQEYEVEPSQKTQDLVVALKTGKLPASADVRILSGAPRAPEATPQRANAADASPRLVVVVGDFTAHGIEPEHSHIVVGYRHELIARLVRFREWSVFDGREGVGGVPSARANARCLTIDGRAYPEPRGVGLTLTLRDQNTGQFLWSNKHVVSLERWSELLQAVVRQVAIALRVHISSERLSRLSKWPDTRPSIFDRWLQGQEYCLHWRPADELRATEIFRSIIRDDPLFGPGYSSLVSVLNSRHLIFAGIVRSRAREKEALELALKAVQLDSFDSRAQLCLAWSYALNSRYDEAILAYRLAYDLNDADPWTFVSASQGLAFCGETDEATGLSKQVLGLGLGAAPIHWGYLVGTRFLAGDMSGCIEAADHAQDAILNLPAWKASALANLGMTDEAQAEAARFIGLVRENWVGESQPTLENIAAWVLTGFPIRDRAAWEQLRRGLALAGLPYAGISVNHEQHQR